MVTKINKRIRKEWQKKSLPMQLLDYAKENREGFTVEVVNGQIIPYGYTKDRRYIISTTNYKSRAEIIKNFRGFNEGIVSGWYDRKEKKFYINKNLAVKNELSANALAKRYNQKSIFDYLTKKEVPVAAEKRISKRGRKKKLERAVVRDILKSNKNVQRYHVKGDMYEMGYFYNKQKGYWMHAKRYTYFTARGFYRINHVEPPQFFSTGLLFKKIWPGRWLPLSYFNTFLNRSLRPNLSHKNQWYQCYKYFAYEYNRGYFYYDNKGKMHTLILEEYAREKS